MSVSKVGSAPSPQVSTSTKPAEKGTESAQKSPQSVPSKELEQWKGDVENLAQHLASDTSLKNRGQIRDQAEGALRELTGLQGSLLQELVRQTTDKVEEINLSSNDRWLHAPIQGDPGDIFSPPGGQDLNPGGSGFISGIGPVAPNDSGFTSDIGGSASDDGFTSNIGIARRGGPISV